MTPPDSNPDVTQLTRLADLLADTGTQPGAESSAAAGLLAELRLDIREIEAKLERLEKLLSQ